MSPDFSPARFSAALRRLGAALLLFALANLVLALVLDAARYRAGAGEPGVINNARREKPEILILGSSRAKHHFDDKQLTRILGIKTFNAGYGGQTVPFARVVLEQLARVHHPKLIIVDVAVFGDDFDRAHALDPWYFDSPILRGFPPPGSNPDTGTADWKSAAIMHLPAYRFAGQFFETIKNGRARPADSGFEPLAYKKRPLLPPREKPVNKSYPWLVPQLEALLAEVRAIDARLILTYAPMKSDAQRLSVIQPTAQFAQKHGIPFVEFTEQAYPEFIPDALYEDGAHLTGEGAAIFTRKVANIIADNLPESLQKTRPQPTT